MSCGVRGIVAESMGVYNILIIKNIKELLDIKRLAEVFGERARAYASRQASPRGLHGQPLVQGDGHALIRSLASELGRTRTPRFRTADGFVGPSIDNDRDTGTSRRRLTTYRSDDLLVGHPGESRDVRPTKPAPSSGRS